MKKQVPSRKTKKTPDKLAWYFARIGFLAIPWRNRKAKDPKGVLFKHYFLIQAKTTKSAIAKLNCILQTMESLDGGASLNGKKILYKQVGILDLDPLCEPIESGAEIFDESELAVKYSAAKRQRMSAKQIRHLAAWEKKNGHPPLLQVYWGRDFDRL